MCWRLPGPVSLPAAAGVGIHPRAGLNVKLQQWMKLQHLCACAIRRRHRAPGNEPLGLPHNALYHARIDPHSTTLQACQVQQAYLPGRALSCWSCDAEPNDCMFHRIITNPRFLQATLLRNNSALLQRICRRQEDVTPVDADKEGDNSPCESAHTVFATQGLRVISKEISLRRKG